MTKMKIGSGAYKIWRNLWS